MKHARFSGLLLALCAVCAHSAPPLPAISIIIDDMGDRLEAGREVALLPGAVACAILPATPHGTTLARLAHAQGKEVLLHFPLQPLEGKAHPLAITVRSDRNELARRLRDDLDALPYVIGVNTHQGSLLSQRLQPMHWLMAEIKARGNLYFIDSYTTPASVAYSAAQTWGLPSARREVFLDDVREAGEIRQQLMRLVAKAKREGSAIGIGHPYGETIALLRSELPRLAEYGVRLVAPSEVIRLQGGGRTPPQPRYAPLLLKLSLQLSAADPTTRP